LNMTYTVMSKRKLLELVNNNIVNGWNDPRMPTISAVRRRGYTAESIRMFCEKIGVQKRENLIDLSLLEFCVREDLNKNATRRLAVLDPVKLVITNYPDAQVEELQGENNPEAEDGGGSRTIPFTKELWIEREDFMENPPKKFFRLGVGLSVRLKYAYIVKCTGFKKDEAGNVTEVYAEYITESRSVTDNSGISVKGTIHWVSVPQALTAEVRLYDRLFRVEDPLSEEGDFKDYINPDSLQVLPNVYIEPALGEALPNERYQFLRKGYFCVDENSTKGKLVFNRTVGLKDTWAKEVKKA
ncbi:MAG TPA: glutamate--tRNA ligase family protein, partial [Segetibacter sp.]